MAENLDRGLFVADPIVTGRRRAPVRCLRRLRPGRVRLWASSGFRFDLYDPNADFFDSRARPAAARRARRSRRCRRWSGVRLKDRARLSLQYDLIIDNLARDATGVPTDLSNDQSTCAPAGGPVTARARTRCCSRRGAARGARAAPASPRRSARRAAARAGGACSRTGALPGTPQRPAGRRRARRPAG